MAISVSIMNTVFCVVETQLVAHGFERRKSGIFTIKMSADAIGWIGLNTATRGQKGFLEINPVVGVRNQQIERLVAELTGEKFDEITPPTLCGNTGYMM